MISRAGHPYTYGEAYRNVSQTLIVTWLISCCSFPLYAHTLDADNPKLVKPSPRATINNYLRAILRGEPEKISSAFDLQSQNGKIAAEANKQIATFVAYQTIAIRRIEEKFGAKGMALAKSKLGWGDARGREEEIRKYVQSDVKMFLGEDGESAVAYTPEMKQEYIRLKHENGKWLIDVSKKEALGLTVAMPAVKLLAEETKQLDNRVKESKTIEELDKYLEAWKKHLSDGVKLLNGIMDEKQ